jgi:hypothetical protein
MNNEDYDQLVIVVTRLQHIGYTYNGRSYNSVENKASFKGWRDVFIWLGSILHQVFDDFYTGDDTAMFHQDTHDELKRLEAWLWDEGDVDFFWADLELLQIDHRLGELFAALPLLVSADRRVSFLVCELSISQLIVN